MSNQEAERLFAGWRQVFDGKGNLDPGGTVIDEVLAEAIADGWMSRVRFRGRDLYFAGPSKRDGAIFSKADFIAFSVPPMLIRGDVILLTADSAPIGLAAELEWMVAS